MLSLPLHRFKAWVSSSLSCGLGLSARLYGRWVQVTWSSHGACFMEGDGAGWSLWVGTWHSWKAVGSGDLNSCKARSYFARTWAPRAAEAGRDFQRSLIQPLLQAGPTSWAGPVRSWIVPGDGDSTASLAAFLLFHCLTVFATKTCFFLHLNRFPGFQFVYIASHPVPGHHWEEPGFLFFTATHPHQVFIRSHW